MIMKKLCLLFTMLLLVVACSSGQKEKVIKTGAKALGDGAASFMDKTYKAKMSSSDYSELKCNEEAVAIGDKVRVMVEEKLGVPQTNGVMSLSVGGSIAKIACGQIAQKLVPDLINKNIADYPCFGKVAANEAADFVEKELCNSIEF
jgi:hypothetical protein